MMRLYFSMKDRIASKIRCPSAATCLIGWQMCNLCLAAKAPAKASWRQWVRPATARNKIDWLRIHRLFNTWPLCLRWQAHFREVLRESKSSIQLDWWGYQRFKIITISRDWALKKKRNRISIIFLQWWCLIKGSRKFSNSHGLWEAGTSKCRLWTCLQLIMIASNLQHR